MDAISGGWRVLKDWNKPKPAPEPIPEVMDELRQRVEEMQAQQQMYALQNMQSSNPYQNLQPYQQQMLNAMRQAPLPPPPPMTHTLYGLKCDTLSANYAISGLMLIKMKRQQIEEHVRRALADRLAAEIMRKLPLRQEPDRNVNRDDVVFTATIHVAYEDRK